MNYNGWNEMLYTEEEFNNFFRESNGFNDDINRNSRVRDDGKNFATFIDAGSDALLRDCPEFIACLI